MSAVLPVDASINILNPVIATGEFPNNLCALKILRDLADQQGKDFNDSHLVTLMPNIARVRKNTSIKTFADANLFIPAC